MQAHQNPASSFRGSLESDTEYVAAVEQERLVRLAAFLGITETVCGFELRPMTLRHLSLLQISQNSLLVDGKTPSPVEVAQFLWILSPSFSKSKIRRWFFLQRVRRSIRTIEKAAALVHAIRAFREESFQDRQGGNGGAMEVEYFSEAASICGWFAREYGGGIGMRQIDEIMDLPLKIVFQMSKEILRHHLGKKAGLANKSSELLHK